MRTFQRPYNFKSNGRVGSWYAIKNVSTELAEISIYDEIGYWGVTASDFVKELGSIQAAALNIRINSPGGDVFDGIAILNALRSHPGHKTVTIDGLAASAASFIAMAGDTVQMAPQSMMMIHDASGLCMGNAGDMRELADLLDKTSENIANVYAQRSGKPAEDWRAAMHAETWYTDKEAVDAGLADKIVGDDTAEQQTPEPVVAKTTTSVTSERGPEAVSWDDVEIDVEAITKALKGE
jgi:ATP-dependent protease ClpP protease subunit